MSILDNLLSCKSELLHKQAESIPVVLMTRIRLARNLDGFPFPGWSGPDDREAVWEKCSEALTEKGTLNDPMVMNVGDLTKLERQILVERHLVSRELSESDPNAGAVINNDQSCSVMVNEEDHLRLQVIRTGYGLRELWKRMNEIDNALEKSLDFAFSTDLGYLTACPTNVGTGMRASAMMHLPGLVIAKHMDKVIRAVNQLGIVVRGLFGEGSDATGSIFQISNQQTLGESEMDIIKRLGGVLDTIIEQEQNARQKLLEKESYKILDKLGRAYGVLQNGHVSSSSEAMNLLSLIRLAVDLNVFPEEVRGQVDRLFVECQPAHIQYLRQGKADSLQRDIQRAKFLRDEFRKLPLPNFDKFQFSI